MRPRECLTCGGLIGALGADACDCLGPAGLARRELADLRVRLAAVEADRDAQGADKAKLVQRINNLERGQQTLIAERNALVAKLVDAKAEAAERLRLMDRALAERDRLAAENAAMRDLLRSLRQDIQHHNCFSESCDACDIDAALAPTRDDDDDQPAKDEGKV